MIFIADSSFYSKIKIFVKLPCQKTWQKYKDKLFNKEIFLNTAVMSPIILRSRYFA